MYAATVRADCLVADRRLSLNNFLQTRVLNEFYSKLTQGREYLRMGYYICCFTKASYILCLI